VGLFACWRMEPPSRCCCFGTEFTRRFLTCDAWNPFTGPRWNVNKLRWQLVTDTILTAIIFILTETVTHFESETWRPLKWTCIWILLSVVCTAVGVTGAVRRSAGFLVTFIVAMVILCAINLSHINQMRAELYRSCKLSQKSFRNCDPDYDTEAQGLRKCIFNNTCEERDLQQTKCEAPTAYNCSDQNEMDWIFFSVEIINFLTYVEPVFMALLLLIRAEFTDDTCPTPPKEEHELPCAGMEWGNPSVFYHKDEEDEAFGSQSEREAFARTPEDPESNEEDTATTLEDATKD